MRPLIITLMLGAIVVGCSKREKISTDREIDYSNVSTIEDAQSSINDISDGGVPLASYYTGGFFLYSYKPKGNYSILDSLGPCFVRKRMGTDNDSDRIYSADTLIFNSCSGSKTIIIQNGPFAGDTLRIEYTLNGQIVRSDPNDNDPYVFNVIRGIPDPFQTNIKLYLNSALVSNKTHYSHFELSTSHSGNNMNFNMSRTINTINEFNECQRTWNVSGTGTIDFSNAQTWHPGIKLLDNQELYISFDKSGYLITCSGKKFYVYIKTDPNLIVKGSCRRPDGSLKIYSGKIIKTITDSASFTKVITIQWNNCQDNPIISQ
ncbi:MAG: hypothetical protein ABIL47_05955 [candidate division WOR-3 bacterium]